MLNASDRNAVCLASVASAVALAVVLAVHQEVTMFVVKAIELFNVVVLSLERPCQ